MKLLLPLAVPVLALSQLVPAQQTNVTATTQPAPRPNPCTLAEQKQFDFWVGAWDASWPGAKDGEVDHGSNQITRVLDNCVVQENFNGGDSMHLRGMSVS